MEGAPVRPLCGVVTRSPSAHVARKHWYRAKEETKQRLEAELERKGSGGFLKVSEVVEVFDRMLWLPSI